MGIFWFAGHGGLVPMSERMAPAIVALVLLRLLRFLSLNVDATLKPDNQKCRRSAAEVFSHSRTFALCAHSARTQ